MSSDIEIRIDDLKRDAADAEFTRNGFLLLGTWGTCIAAAFESMPRVQVAGMIIGVGSFALGIAANLKSVDCTARANGLVDGERQRIADTMINVAIGLTKQ